MARVLLSTWHGEWALILSTTIVSDSPVEGFCSHIVKLNFALHFHLIGHPFRSAIILPARIENCVVSSIASIWKKVYYWKGLARCEILSTYWGRSVVYVKTRFGYIPHETHLLFQALDIESKRSGLRDHIWERFCASWTDATGKYCPFARLETLRKNHCLCVK